MHKPKIKPTGSVVRPAVKSKHTHKHTHTHTHTHTPIQTYTHTHTHIHTDTHTYRFHLDIYRNIYILESLLATLIGLKYSANPTWRFLGYYKFKIPYISRKRLDIDQKKVFSNYSNSVLHSSISFK